MQPHQLQQLQTKQPGARLAYTFRMLINTLTDLFLQYTYLGGLKLEPVWLFPT